MNTFRSQTQRKGFTLIELLVVIFIIGVLSAIIFPQLAGMREKARDTERMTDVRQIQNALELYYNRRGEYPGNLGGLSTYMPSGVPRDPTTDANYAYSTTSTDSCDGGTALYSLRFTAENQATFANDTSVTLIGSDTVCVDLLSDY